MTGDFADCNNYHFHRITPQTSVCLECLGSAVSSPPDNHLYSPHTLVFPLSLKFNNSVKCIMSGCLSPRVQVHRCRLRAVGWQKFTNNHLRSGSACFWKMFYSLHTVSSLGSVELLSQLLWICRHINRQYLEGIWCKFLNSLFPWKNLRVSRNVLEFQLFTQRIKVCKCLIPKGNIELF